MLRITLFSLICWSLVPFSFAHVETGEVEYAAGDTTMKGYLARSSDFEGPRPGVLVVHEWWGHNEYARKRARMLAEMGYTALAVDMYGDGKTAAHPDEAGAFAGQVMNNLDVAKARFTAALDFLKAQEGVDPDKIAAIGYCFGGGVVLDMARMGVDLDGVASFHGSLATKTPAEKGQVKAAVLVCHGADDGFVPEEQIAAFKEEMESAGVDLTFKTYPGARHSFTNPDADKLAADLDMPIGYHAEADKASWAELERFLVKVFAE